MGNSNGRLSCNIQTDLLLLDQSLVAETVRGSVGAVVRKAVDERGGKTVTGEAMSVA